MDPKQVLASLCLATHTHLRDSKLDAYLGNLPNAVFGDASASLGTRASFGSYLFTDRVVVRLKALGEIYGGFEMRISQPPLRSAVGSLLCWVSSYSCSAVINDTQSLGLWSASASMSARMKLNDELGGSIRIVPSWLSRLRFLSARLKAREEISTPTASSRPFLEYFCTSS